MRLGQQQMRKCHSVQDNHEDVGSGGGATRMLRLARHTSTGVTILQRTFSVLTVNFHFDSLLSQTHSDSVTRGPRVFLIKFGRFEAEVSFGSITSK